MDIQRPTLPTNPNKPYPTRFLADVTHIIVHHSLTTTGSAEAYARYHIGQYDWPGIAYHFEIAKDGTISGTLDLKKIGYHCKGMNTVGIGVVLTGNFDNTKPTPAQVESLANLIVYLRRDIGRKLEFARHSDFSTKSCPGNLFPWNELTNRVAVLEFTGPPVVVPVDPDDQEPTIVMPDHPNGAQTGSGELIRSFSWLEMMAYMVIVICIIWGIASIS